ncbi:MAG TPA: hypothetical protein DCE42_30220 [Myxococcales bacterium]|nr:hypothetical protein [Deltaproteobacteria bacterium]MBU53688.1 hypothetical protein [Deltaproteobacteria bacterium]HAA59069.1 hypothetical protein [Myxococcales bacterium]|tara:strand:- start:29192 stop:30046 length:855 start_codon:yes stop_codon:yes gene_type:complete
MSVKFPKQAPVQQQPEIVCPVMRGMVADGHLHADKNGDAKISELKDIFEDLGFSRGLANVAVVGNGFGDILGNVFSGTFNLNELRGGLLDHSGDSMILRNGAFDPEKFETLISHSSDGERMTQADFEKAIKTNRQADDGSWMGSRISKVEFGILLKAFGTKGKDGEMGISISDLRGLYQDKKIPASFRPETKATTQNAVATLSAKARSMPSDSHVGMAKAGADSALQGDNLFDNGGIAAKGMGQGICPHMGSGGAQMTADNPAEITQLHNELPQANPLSAEATS